ncbi:MAG: serine hydrolase [Chitinophagales bacterium]|nr:serine hydrolase [Chitinophagales bacterium]
MRFLQVFVVLLLSSALFAQKADKLLSAEMDNVIREQFSDPKGPGCVALVARQGKVIYHKAFGMNEVESAKPLQTDMVFRIGSVTKQFTAVGILQLVDEGKIGLSDEMQQFLENCPEAWKTVTVEQLLNHTSGIHSYTSMAEFDNEFQGKALSVNGLIDFFKNEPLDFPPGNAYAYSNSGYVLLGYIIEKVSGQTYADFLQKRFFTPLGLKNTYYDTDGLKIDKRVQGYDPDMDTIARAAFLSMSLPYAAGSICANAEDLLRWTTSLHSGKLLSDRLYRKACSAGILPSGESIHYGYGLMIGSVLGSPTVEHGGSINGFLSHVLYLPKEQICAVVLSNCTCQSPDAVAAKIAALAAGKRLKPDAIAVSDLKIYEGVFVKGELERYIRVNENGVLTSQRKGGPVFKLTPFEADNFMFDSGLATGKFKRDAAGKITEIAVSDRVAEASVWTKTDKALPELPKEILLNEADLKPFTGIYQLVPGFDITVTQQGKRLFIQATGQQSIEMFARTPTRFFAKEVDAEIEFSPENNSFILFQNGQEMEAKRK